MLLRLVLVVRLLLPHITVLSPLVEPCGKASYDEKVNYVRRPHREVATRQERVDVAHEELEGKGERDHADTHDCL